MKACEETETLSDQQLTQLFQELESETGCKKLGEAAYQEALAAEDFKTETDSQPPPLLFS